jgi:hypothetical protein
MNTFFTTIEQIRVFVTVDISSRFETIKPYLLEAKKFIYDILGEDTYTELLDYVNDTEAETDEALDALLPYVQAPLANFAYMLGAHKLFIQVGETGLVRSETSSFTPAKPEEIELLKKSFASSGYNALEELILFIDRNAETYADAYAHLFAKRFIVNTAQEMNDLIFVNITNLDFLDMKKIINLTENNDLRDTMGATLFAAIKVEVAEGDISEDHEALLATYFRPALAHLAYAKWKKDEDHRLTGEKLLEQYRNAIAEEAETTVERYQNDGENPFFVAGY